jgi:3-deoxy-manno-octulosonate cytidylyltransferase (CMP-KDO synthetase)
MLQHVWERTCQARYLTDVVIATDDERIRAAAEDFRARVVMTRADHVSGTDRVAEAASASPAPIIVNVQGDEPMIDPGAIDAAILGLLDDDMGAVPMGTLKKRIERVADIQDPNVVKVVADAQGNALYFSRSAIPYAREGDQPAYFKHIGLYVYRRDFLLSYPDLPVGPLERAERLEQLRALENGFKIRVIETEYESLGVDTPDDWKQVAELFEKPMVNR